MSAPGTAHAPLSRARAISETWSEGQGACTACGAAQGFLVRCSKSPGRAHKSMMCSRCLRTAPAGCPRCEHEARVEARKGRNSTGDIRSE